MVEEELVGLVVSTLRVKDRQKFKFYYLLKVQNQISCHIPIINFIFSIIGSFVLFQTRAIEWLALCFNKIIMKIDKERNPYLKRIFSEKPHRYSYDIHEGKYYLMDEEGNSTNINPNGTFRPKFKSNYSGFVDHKSRYRDYKDDPSLLHFAPDPTPKSGYHQPMTNKFAGYAQYPYKIGKQFPAYLKKSTERHQYKRKKAQSVLVERKIDPKQESLIQLTFKRFENEENSKFFNDAWDSIVQTKPLPNKMKKSCYNYKCKYLKQVRIDKQNKMESMRTHSKAMQNTLGRSFHEEALSREMQESKFISTMAFSSQG